MRCVIHLVYWFSELYNTCFRILCYLLSSYPGREESQMVRAREDESTYLRNSSTPVKIKVHVESGKQSKSKAMGIIPRTARQSHRGNSTNSEREKITERRPTLMLVDGI